MSKYHLAALSMALLVLSCAEEPIMDKPINPNLIPLNISSSINQQHTKATADGFVDKDAVGLYAVNYTENNTVAGTLQVSGNQADNVKYVFDESAHKWVPVKGVYYKDVNTNVDIYLYYPYQASISNMTAGVFEVSKDQSSEKTETTLSGYEASDFLWGKKAGVTPSESSVGVQLSHKMSAVNLKLSEGTGFGTEEFEGLEKNVILVNTTRKATIDYSTGVVTKVGDPQQDGIVMCPQEDGSFRAIVVPQSVAVGTNLFAITIDGVTYGFQHTAAVDYLAGKQLDVTVEISKKSPSGDLEFKLAGTQITEWTEDKNTHGGEARQYFVVNVTEPGTLGATIKAMGKNPDKIKNLKVVGNVRDDDFYFMRDSMAILEAINMKESDIKGSGEIYRQANVQFGDEYEMFCRLYGTPDENDGVVATWLDNGGYIPRDAFNGKKNLCFFVFPEHVKIIGNNAFTNTTLSGTLIIPEEVELIEDRAFQQTAIASVTFNNKIKIIGDCAFEACKSLSGTLILPESLISIEPRAFESCSFSGELYFPEKLESIGEGAFRLAGSFTNGLKLPDKIRKLGDWTFNGCMFKGSLDLNNCEEIGSYCFDCNEGFSGELVIPEGVILIPDFCFQGSNFSKIIFPKSLRIIKNAAFSNNNRLYEIDFREGLISIEPSAFESCGNLLSLKLPSTLQAIGANAFQGCSGLSSITSEAIEPPVVPSNTFDGVAKDNFTVEVPAQSVKMYQAEPGWSDFTRIAAHYDFSVSRERMRALNAEQTRTYTLRAPANFNWSIQSKPDWVTVSPESGTGKTDITITVGEMEKTSETFEVNEGTYNSPNYQSYKGRSGEIVFQLDEEGVNYTCSFEVEQYDSDYSDGENKVLQTHSKGNGIDIIFVGDGYDAKDIAKGTFLSNAEEGYAAFFNVEPYKTYKDYFNVYAVVSQSDDSGIGTVNTVKDSKFGTYFTQNRIKVPESEPIFTWAKKADNGVDFTKTLVINLLNTSAYEGICAMYGDGSAIAFCPVSRDAYPYDFRGIIQHEAGGHGFGKLGDEYIYHNAFIQTCDCLCCEHPMGDNDTKSTYGVFKSLGWFKNLSMSGDMHQVPWSHLIYNPKYSNYVDMYEGGYMHSRGVYRSEATSCMNNNIPYYSAISRQAMVERILSIAGEEFTLEKFYEKDSDEFGAQTKAVWNVPFDRTFGVDPKWNRGSEEGSVIYMGEHPDYSKIK